MRCSKVRYIAVWCSWWGLKVHIPQGCTQREFVRHSHLTYPRKNAFSTGKSNVCFSLDRIAYDTLTFGDYCCLKVRYCFLGLEGRDRG